MDQQFPGQGGGAQSPPEPGAYPGQPSSPAPGAQGQPYQPPQQPGYAPPGYAQGYEEGGYPPPSSGGYAPAPQKKPFNWLACCGISCGVALLIGVLVWVLTLKMCGGLVGPVIQMGLVASQVQKADASTITAAAEAVTAEQLSANPDAYKGKWIALEGVLGNQSDPAAQQMSGQTGQSGTSYYMAPNIIITDLSLAAPVGDEADTVKVYGKAVKFDLKEMLKGFGEEAVKEIENDPQMKGMTTFIMVFAKKAELVSAGEPAAQPEGAAAPTADAAASQ